MVLREVCLEELTCRLRRVGANEQVDVLLGDGSPLDERLHGENRIPVLAAVQQNLNLLGELLGLHQRQDLEHLVERSKPSRENYQGLREVREPELAHEEVVELEMKAVGDVRVGSLLVRKADVQTNRLAARFRGSAA